MIASLFLFIHVAAGTIALVVGYLAFAYKKGSRAHRSVGKAFVFSMVLMGGFGAALAYAKPEFISSINGLLAAYLVTTGWVAIKRKKPGVFFFDKLAFGFASLLAFLDFYFGSVALKSETGTFHGFPAVLYFFFGAVAALAAVLDAKMILQGGIAYHQKMIRHIWRMCFAMFLAAASFFLGQMQVFPVFLQSLPVLSLPVLTVLILMVFCLY